MTKQTIYYLTVRSTSDDRKTSAVIRDSAMTLFAERGSSGVTLRQVAVAAGVSPGLVIHHFGSKEGLEAAIDERVVDVVDALARDVVRLENEGELANLLELFVARLEAEPALAGYVARMLLDDLGRGDRLFAHLFESVLSGLESLAERGHVRTSDDAPTRAAFLLANDLALIMLRRRIEKVLGVDPLSRSGLERWGAVVVDSYLRGVFSWPADASDDEKDPS